MELNATLLDMKLRSGHQELASGRPQTLEKWSFVPLVKSTIAFDSPSLM
jgi:hypothetical protein